MLKRRKILRLQFGLRTLLVAVLVAAIASAYVADLVSMSRTQREFLELANEAGVSVQVNSQNFALGSPGVHLGAFDRVTSVEFSPDWRRNLDAEPESLPGQPDFDSLIELITPEGPWIPVRSELRQASLRRLGGLRYLANLNLHCEAVQDADLRALRSLEKLELLDLSCTSVTDAGMAQLSALRELRRLSIGRTGVGNKGLTCVARSPRLELLDAGSTKVSDGASPVLNSLRNLRWLYLDDTKVVHLHLRGLANLEYLTLRGTHVRELTVEGCGSLRRLDLAGTHISDETIAPIGRIDSLEELDLGDTNITGLGAEQLCKLPKLKKLRIDCGALLDSKEMVLAGSLPAIEEIVVCGDFVFDHREPHTGLECIRVRWKKERPNVRIVAVPLFEGP